MNKSQFYYILTLMVLLPLVILFTLIYLPIRLIIRPIKMPELVKNPVKSINGLKEHLRAEYILLGCKSVPICKIK